MSTVTKTIVVAVSRNGVIGRDGDMPWRLSTDLKRFKALTLGKPMIMGRKTFQSIGRPLPGRPNYRHHPRRRLQRRRGAQSHIRSTRRSTIAQALAEQNGADEICIVGGGEIYRQAIGDRRHAARDACRGRGRRRHVFPGDRSRGIRADRRASSMSRRAKRTAMRRVSSTYGRRHRIGKSNYFPINPAKFLKLR